MLSVAVVASAVVVVIVIVGVLGSSAELSLLLLCWQC